MSFQKVGIIGSGSVGQRLAEGFARVGKEVKVGTRDPSKLKEWIEKSDNKISASSFSEAAKFGDIIVICTKWEGTQNAILLTGKENFANKIVIDVTNPLKFDTLNAPPGMAIAYPNSAGKTIQQWLPNSKVVKAFNSVPAHYMANPKLEEGAPDLFIAGNDATAKNEVKALANQWGWENINDLGSIDNAYLLEALAMVWITYGFANNYWTHAFKLLKK